MKSGDIVKCIDNSGNPRHFTKGREYVVSHMTDNCLVWAIGDFGETTAMFDYRFKLQPKSQPKFKAGDRVKLKFGFAHDEGTIVSCNDHYATCKWDDEKGNGRAFNVSNLELVENEITLGALLKKALDARKQENCPAVAPVVVTAIVAELLNGKPKPSTSPMVHRSGEAATAEAERLSRKHPGVEFGTFIMQTVSHTPKPVVVETSTRAA